MLEKIIAFMGGFLTAYLVIRAMRSFKSITGCLLILMMPIMVQGQGWGYHYMKNESGGTVYKIYKLYNDEGYTSLYGSQGAGDLGNGGVAGPFGDNTKWGKAEWYDHSGGTLLQATAMGKVVVGSPITNIYSGITTYTNYTSEVCCTNTQPISVIYSMTIYRVSDNEIVAFQQPIIPAFGYYCKTVTLPYAWRFSMVPLWQQEGHEYGCYSTNTTPTVGTNNVPPETPDDSDGSNPGGNPTKDKYPEINDGGETNQIANDNRNVEAILNALGIMNSKIIDYRPWLNTTTNLLGQINDKTFDYREYWKTNNNQNTAMTNHLSTMTNQLGTLTNQGAQITNLLTQMNTNISNVRSNTEPVDASLTNQLQGYMNTASNTASTIMGGIFSTSGLQHLTNFDWTRTETNGTMPADTEFLRFHLGQIGAVDHWIDLDYTHNMSSSLVADVVGFVNWVQFWLGWVISLVLYIAVVYRLDELWPVVLGDVRENTKVSSNATAKGYATKMLIGLPVVLMVAAFIVILPTILTQLYATYAMHGVSGNPMRGVTSPIQQVNLHAVPSISSFASNALQYVTHLITMAIPIGTASVAFMNWIIFYQMSRFIANLIGAALWTLQKFLPLLVIGICVSQVNAAQVRIENLTGQDVTFSNQTTQMKIPEGSMYVQELAMGSYDWGSTNFSVPEFGCLVLRFEMKKSGEPYIETGQEWSTIDCFMYGMVTGFSIFGFAFVVNLMWQGWQLRNGA